MRVHRFRGGLRVRIGEFGTCRPVRSASPAETEAGYRVGSLEPESGRPVARYLLALAVTTLLTVAYGTRHEQAAVRGLRPDHCASHLNPVPL